MTAPAESLRKQILAAMQRRDFSLDDDAFNDLALRVFEFQFTHNLPYRKYCERRQVQPGRVPHWLQIPAVPTAAFKEAALVAGDANAAQAVFLTSGTTQGQEKRGKHHVLDLELYDASLLPTFARFVLAYRKQMPIISLVPEWQPGGTSSLGYMITTAMRELGGPESGFAVTEQGIDYEQLHDWLHDAINENTPVCIAGTSLAFVHWFDHLRANNLSFQLPARSRVMDTGGFKGLERSISSAELEDAYAELLGIGSKYVINEYGMTEMLSQYYDAKLPNAAQHAPKQGPPWVRFAVVDATTLEPLPPGETGLLRHFDLANLFSVSAIQTEDLGRTVEAGFQLLGRAAGAPPRGCSIAMDMFLSAVQP